MLTTEGSESTITQLVLQTGSRAGLRAPIRFGYYMIGRHKECQIRPKSRSVSRHHCLLHRDDNGVKVLDLDSTSGTRLNEEKLEPRTWIPVSDGDMLRCGKIVFRISIAQDIEQELAGREVAAVGAASGGGGSMLTGEAWQEVDIADYLDAEDDAERVRRYGEIRERHETSDASEDSDAFEQFEDDFDGTSSTLAEDGSAESDQAPERSEGPESDPSPGEDSERPSGKRKRPGRLPKKHRRKLAGSTISASFGDVERMKMMAAVMLTVATVACLGYSAFRYYSGPNVRVLEGID